MKEQIKKAAKEYCEIIYSDVYEVSTLAEQKLQCVNDFEFGANFANQIWEEKTRWIPVGERLPKQGTSVLVRDDSVSPIRSVALFEDGRFYPDFLAIKDKNVTHWKEII